MNNKGVSIITLIITIIVIIILASIAIVENSNATGKATIAKFKSEFSEFSTLTKNEYFSRLGKFSTGNTKEARSKVYYMIASGKDYDEVKKNPTEPAGTVDNLTIDILGEALLGNEYYEIVDDTNIAGVSKHKQWYSSTEKHYVTDEGNVFILPGFLEDDEGVYKWWINEHSYYITTTSEGEANTPVTPAPDVPGGTQETIVITGNKFTVSGVEIEMAGDITKIDMDQSKGDGSIQQGIQIYSGTVVAYNGDLYTSRWETYIDKNARESFISNGAALKLNVEKGVITPSDENPPVEGDLKLENGELYVYRPYGTDYTQSHYWIKLFKQPKIEIK